MFKFFIVAALVPAMAMASVSFSACTNGAPTPTSLTVNNCAGRVCTLVSGQPLYAVASGIVCPYGSSFATASVVARIASVGPAYPVPIYNTGGIVGGGPVVARVPFSYVLSEKSLIVPTRGIPVEVEVDLTGDRGVKLGCVRFNAVIQ
ncbi:uncharacterized protein LOC135698260 [Ochlerotatus camptorhynchus]|uniref:uncharacterized protein LOC135698260 n=1 Tax=Ochlerotatus camptorhynchus TaxID=644619 RepID=UPI0031E286A0